MRAGEQVARNSWLSTARAFCSSSQCTGPVVVLKAPARRQMSRVKRLACQMHKGTLRLVPPLMLKSRSTSCNTAGLCMAMLLH